MHCTLELCARTFTTPYYDNFSAAPLVGPRTALVTTRDGTTEGNAASAFIGLEPASPGQLPEETKFRINYCNYKDIAKYLVDLFTTSMSTTGVVGTTNDSSTSGTNQQIRQRITPGLGLAFSQFDNIAELMDEVANSMTEAFRTSANNTVLDGVAMSSVTYIEITWPPLILPISLVLMTFTILIVMIIRNNQRGMPIWKSSSLALLFHELSGWDSSKTTATGPEEVEERAKSMRTRVTNGGGKLLFSKADSTTIAGVVTLRIDNVPIHIIGGNSDNSESERNTTSDDLSGDETDGSGDFPEAIGVDISVPSPPVSSTGQYPMGQSESESPSNNNGEPDQQLETASHSSSPASQISGQISNFPGQQAQVQIHGHGVQSETGIGTLPSGAPDSFISQESANEGFGQVFQSDAAESAMPSHNGTQSASGAATTGGQGSAATYSTQESLPGYVQQFPVSQPGYEQGGQISLFPSDGNAPYDDQHRNPAPSGPPAFLPGNGNRRFSNHLSLNSGTSYPVMDSDNQLQPGWRANAIGDASGGSSFSAPVGTKPPSSQGLPLGAPTYAASEQQPSVPAFTTTGGWAPKKSDFDADSCGVPNAEMNRKGQAQDAGHMSAAQPGPFSNQVVSPSWPVETGQGNNQSYLSPTTAQALESSYDPWAPQTGASNPSKTDPWEGAQTTGMGKPNSAWDSQAEPMYPGPSAKP
ncbi:hypothetical protein CGCA056_v010445 [Colletotrichum aenigma]|uniref:uncharacterized protein n=1 Tax=Colletotrichum aenigma TaxID=1215731 RepID=UPI0018726C34|nr:uncharacterized protein CGCA056_v010445 [Colletotrichum aenigma]KAF5517503.1 hypothetical protein CGCA056_v010445 [Colletotrichum aenigma]